jgi:hypothetical protein
MTGDGGGKEHQGSGILDEFPSWFLQLCLYLMESGLEGEQGHIWASLGMPCRPSKLDNPDPVEALFKRERHLEVSIEK